MVTCRTTISSSTTHGCFLIAPKHRIADSPGLMIGVPASTPKTPTLVIVKVPPLMSAGWVFPSRATAVRSPSAAARSTSESVLGVLDVRDHQAARGGGRDAEVDVVLEDDLLGRVVPHRVDLRRTPHREDRGAGQHQQRRDLDVAELAAALEPLDELDGAGGVDGHPLGDVRGGERRLHHRAGHHLADALDRLAGLPLARATGFEARQLGAPRPSPPSSRRPLSTSSRRDRAVRAGRLERGQVDAEVLGELAHRRLGEHPQLRRARGLGGARRARPARARRPRPSATRAGSKAACACMWVGLGCPRRPCAARRTGPRSAFIRPTRLSPSPLPRPPGWTGRSPSAGSSAGWGWRGSPRRPLVADRDDRRTDRDGLALLDQQRGDRAGVRRGQLDHRLRGLDLARRCR